MPKTIGIRVDVDFEIGLTKGVSFLLDFFSKNNIKATFYVTMGPDGFRHSIRRICSSGYVKRLINFNPFKTISRFTIMYIAKQFLGRAGYVGAPHTKILKRINSEGHEIGIHGYNHFWWAENIWSSGYEKIKNDMEKAITVFKKDMDMEVKTWASPNWRCSQDSLRLVDTYGFRYGADCRGRYPFFPKIENYIGKTVQLPITLPCLHEIKSYVKRNNLDSIVTEFISHLNDSFNIWCIHGYYEGILEQHLFSALVDRLKSSGYVFVPIINLFNTIGSETVPVCEVIKKAMPGGRGQVSYQGKDG